MRATGARTRFVSIPADRLVAELEEIGTAVLSRGGSYAWRSQGRERVYDLTVPGARAQVRIYTSLAVGENEVRDCGEDAVRVCVGALETINGVPGTSKLRFLPLEKGIKILRTAPQGAEDRVGTFLARLREAIREAYDRARRVRPCPKCGKPLALRNGKYGPFLGCSGYPACKEIVRV